MHRSRRQRRPWGNLAAIFAPLIVFLLIAACTASGAEPNNGDDGGVSDRAETLTPASRAGNQAATEWTIVLEVSGGFAGEFQRVELHSDGSYVVEDFNRELEELGSLAPEDLISIENLVFAAFEASDGGRPPPCADCFVYSLLVSQDDKKRLSITLNDISLVGSSHEPLVRALLAINAEAIQMGN